MKEMMIMIEKIFRRHVLKIVQPFIDYVLTIIDRKVTRLEYGMENQIAMDEKTFKNIQKKLNALEKHLNIEYVIEAEEVTIKPEHYTKVKKAA